MATITELLKEMASEAETTRKMLAQIPDDQLDYRPHPKSMNIRELATHIAEIPGWLSIIIEKDELDFAGEPYVAPPVSSAKDLLGLFEKSYEEGHAALKNADEGQFSKPWTMRAGEQVLSVAPKSENIRMTFCQTVHHRAQLGVFLRLLNVPIPGSYGPSADEMEQYNQQVEA
ncbi:DinB family protein [Chitinophaga sp. GCM10012297]|uniref:DinB family protein n=1 Tax=Chitinophaga chungangae TaxID=2821488 RepID=A0ABS3YBE5_9BACT|nr:DinB family protein [Chitinophaga chungangae]MBO9151984.1 DinB family protein [Chitinophaga chungangae]